MKINSRLGYHPVPFWNLLKMISFGMVAKVVSIILFYKSKGRKIVSAQECYSFHQKKKNKKRFKLLYAKLLIEMKKVVLAFSGGLDTSFAQFICNKI